MANNQAKRPEKLVVVYWQVDLVGGVKALWLVGGRMNGWGP